jgi:molybdopterin molybdotransferase
VTGDELVEIDQKPTGAEIRNTNGYALYHQVKELGGQAEHVGIVRDDLERLTEQMASSLEKDVLLISGGVSMGEFDFVEEVLDRLGVEIHFEKVNIKPGKPLVFAHRDSTLVFGLPGNPVSACTTFEIFVKPALLKLMGFRRFRFQRIEAVLTHDIVSKSSRELYHPAVTTLEGGQFRTSPVTSKGSADILALAGSNSFLIVPGEKDKLEAGETTDVVLRNEFWKGYSVE